MKKRICICLIAAALLLFTGNAYAQFPVSTMLTKAQQQLNKINEAARTTESEASKKKKKELEEATSGSSSCSFDLKFIELAAYDYASKNMWKTSGNTASKKKVDELIDTLAPAKDSYAQALKFVKENWFVEESGVGSQKGINMADVAEKRQERRDYLQYVSARTMSRATSLRKKLADDVESINDNLDQPENGCNEVDDLFVQNLKLFAMVQMQLVSTALQLDALEMTLARNILTEDADKDATEKKSSAGGTGISIPGLIN